MISRNVEVIVLDNRGVGDVIKLLYHWGDVCREIIYYRGSGYSVCVCVLVIGVKGGGIKDDKRGRLVHCLSLFTSCDDTDYGMILISTEEGNVIDTEW